MEKQLNQSNQTNQPVPVVSGPKKTWIFFIIIIIVALLASASVYLWQKSILDQQKQASEQKITELQNQIAQLQQENLYKDWQTYRNEEYGFEVRYPSDWETITFERKENEFANYDFNLKIKKRGIDEYIQIKSGQYISDYPSALQISVSTTKEKDIKALLNKECEEAMTGIGACSTINGDTAFAGVSAVNMIHCVEAANRKGVDMIKNGYYFSIAIPYNCKSDFSGLSTEFNEIDKVYSPIYNQILSTFKFIE